MLSCIIELSESTELLVTWNSDSRELREVLRSALVHVRQITTTTALRYHYTVIRHKLRFKLAKFRMFYVLWDEFNLLRFYIFIIMFAALSFDLVFHILRQEIYNLVIIYYHLWIRHVIHLSLLDQVLEEGLQHTTARHQFRVEFVFVLYSKLLKGGSCVNVCLWVLQMNLLRSLEPG